MLKSLDFDCCDELYRDVEGGGHFLSFYADSYKTFCKLATGEPAGKLKVPV